MKDLRPGTKVILVFIISSLFTYVLIGFIVSLIEQREQRIHKESAKIIQQEISERFSLVLDTTLVIGQLSSPYIFDQNKMPERYEAVLEKILAEKKYILGLSQINKNGKIINVYPNDLNRDAIGKVSQNYSEFLKSYHQEEKFWFSPPFQLFQGGTGFVFYIPINKDQKLLGWMAPVIRSQQFFAHFKTMEFFKDYNLLIKDELTGKIYFETGVPSAEAKIEEIKSSKWGRGIIFQSWPKRIEQSFSLSLTWRLIICLLVGLFNGIVTKINLQKKKAYSRLENISDLLKLTSNEALSKLMDIQTEHFSKGSTGFLRTDLVEKDIQSVTNLIEQIELLQNIAQTEEIKEDTFEVLPLINQHVDVIKEIIKKKNLDIQLDSESFAGEKITGNKWLISNMVLKNALSYCALISQSNGKIKIFYNHTAKGNNIVFTIDQVYDVEVFKAFKIERRLLVARNVIDLINGQILIQENESGEILLRIIIPNTIAIS